MLTDHGFVYLWKELRHVARPCLSPNTPPLHHFETCWPAQCWHSLTFGCDGDGDNYNYDDHTAKEEGEDKDHDNEDDDGGGDDADPPGPPLHHFESCWPAQSWQGRPGKGSAPRDISPPWTVCWPLVAACFFFTQTS